MKTLSILLLSFFTLSINSTFGQKQAQLFKSSELKENYLSVFELKNKFSNFNFSSLWLKTDNRFVYGFIGQNFQRIRIKFISIKKDDNGTYIVFGKSMVKNNICDFKGSLEITNIRKYKLTSYGVDDEYKNKGIIGQYAILGDYVLTEDTKQKNTGVFKGSFKTEFYLTKDDKIHYDDIEIYADGYSNNEFVGTWISNKTKIIKPCNWGDYRVPGSNDLDVGAGEFSPADKYLRFGWQSVRDTYNQGAASEKAKKEEGRAWWK